MDDLDKDQWEAPYRKVAAVHELQESNFLVRLYLECYEKRYKAKFVFPLGNSHLTLIQDIQKMAKDRTPQLIEHYFKMNEPWFKSQTHSLECLKKNLNKVNADFEQRGMKVTSAEPVKVQFFRTCIKCGEHNLQTAFVAEMERVEICDKCSPGGKDG